MPPKRNATHQERKEWKRLVEQKSQVEQDLLLSQAKEAQEREALAPPQSPADRGKCPICLSDLSAKEDVLRLKCGHAMHRIGCSEGLLAHPKVSGEGDYVTCPICRREELISEIEADKCNLCEKYLRKRWWYELDCGHKFHKECVQQIVDEAEGGGHDGFLCPTCRAPTLLSDTNVETGSLLACLRPSKRRFTRRRRRARDRQESLKSGINKKKQTKRKKQTKINRKTNKRKKLIKRNKQKHR